MACRELGFYDVLDHRFSSFDEANGTIWLRELQCNGDEKSLILCKHEKWKTDSCRYHSNDVGVRCKSECKQQLWPEIRHRLWCILA